MNSKVCNTTDLVDLVISNEEVYDNAVSINTNDQTQFLNSIEHFVHKRIEIANMHAFNINNYIRGVMLKFYNIKTSVFMTRCVFETRSAFMAHYYFIRNSNIINP